MRSSEVKDGMRQRYKEKHGVDYAFQNPEVQAKINAKMQENYGVDWPMQNEELHKIMHANSVKTQKTNFYNNVVKNSKDLVPLFDVDEWIAHASCDIDYEFRWRCKKCGKEIKMPLMYGSP